MNCGSVTFDTMLSCFHVRSWKVRTLTVSVALCLCYLVTDPWINFVLSEPFDTLVFLVVTGASSVHLSRDLVTQLSNETQFFIIIPSCLRSVWQGGVKGYLNNRLCPLLPAVTKIILTGSQRSIQYQQISTYSFSPKRTPYLISSQTTGLLTEFILVPRALRISSVK